MLCTNFARRIFCNCICLCFYWTRCVSLGASEVLKRPLNCLSKLTSMCFGHFDMAVQWLSSCIHLWTVRLPIFYHNERLISKLHVAHLDAGICMYTKWEKVISGHFLDKVGAMTQEPKIPSTKLLGIGYSYRGVDCTYQVWGCTHENWG